MKSLNFKEYLTSNININLTQLESCLSYQQIKYFKKGDFLIKEGDICQYSYFVQEGILRVFYIDDKGKEHLLQFAPEGWFAADHESTYFKKASNYYIQALEDTTVYQLKDDFFEQLSLKDPVFTQFNEKLLHNHIHHLQKRIIQLIAKTAEERYVEFTKTYPDILMRVPQTMVASYLGITPESLSRIRKELIVKK
jgi:CRP-like cAMP-binding protein